MKYTDVKYTDKYKTLQVTKLLQDVDNLVKFDFICTNVSRKMINMFKYKCSKCAYLQNNQCMCRYDWVKKQKSCYSLYKFFEKKFFEYAGIKFESDMIMIDLKLKIIELLRDRLIDSFLDVCDFIPDFARAEIVSDINNFCNMCADCRNFSYRCTVGDNDRKSNGCMNSFKIMQKLLSYNKEGHFTL